MCDYSNAKIYKLWSPEGNQIYIGSTTQMLCQRKAVHAHQVMKSCSSKILYEKYSDVRIELLKNVKCDTKEELNRIEGQYIRCNLDRTVNSNIAGRSRTEWCSDNADRYKKYMAEYYIKNKDKIKARQNKPFLCSCGKTINFNNQYRHYRSKCHFKNLPSIDNETADEFLELD